MSNWLALLALLTVTLAAVQPTFAEAVKVAPRGVLDAMKDRQTFYPLDSTTDARFGNSRLSLYLLGGDLSIPISKAKGTPTTRYSVLVNMSPPSPIQVFEIGALNCQQHSADPSFRAAYDPTGKLLWSGPVGSDPSNIATTLMTAAAILKAAKILCDGDHPADALPDRTMSDLR